MSSRPVPDAGSLNAVEVRSVLQLWLELGGAPTFGVPRGGGLTFYEKRRLEFELANARRLLPAT